MTAVDTYWKAFGFLGVAILVTVAAFVLQSLFGGWRNDGRRSRRKTRGKRARR